MISEGSHAHHLVSLYSLENDCLRELVVLHVTVAAQEAVVLHQVTSRFGVQIGIAELLVHGEAQHHGETRQPRRSR